MKRLYLTAVITVPSEEGQKRIDEALEKQNLSMIQETVYRDENGKSREDWEDILSGKVPNGFAEAEKEFYSANQSSEISEDGYMALTPEEIDYAFLDFVLPLREFVSVTDTLEFGSLVKEQDGTITHVQETAEEINYYIEYLNRSKWQVFKDNINSLFRRIKYKLKGIKKVDLEELLSKPENQPEYK